MQNEIVLTPGYSAFSHGQLVQLEVRTYHGFHQLAPPCAVTTINCHVNLKKNRQNVPSPKKAMA